MKRKSQPLYNLLFNKVIKKTPHTTKALLLSLTILMLLTSCVNKKELSSRQSQTVPAQIINTLSKGGTFLHRVFYQGFDPDLATSLEQLNIYIGGDGRPWLGAHKIALDPTPEHATALELFLRDDAPTVFVGRPCYYQTNDPACHPGVWTNGRYSPHVMSSMTEMINTLIRKYSPKNVNLIGYSGGGSLSVLIANELIQIDTVLTIGANLNIEKWTEHHRFSRLDQSVNPADIIINEQVRQVHLTGKKDKNTPTYLNELFYRNNGVKPIIIKDFNHHCCWEKSWPELLNRFIEPQEHH